MYNNISLFFSADCNMKCKYCDMNNYNIDLKQYNNKIRQSIESGDCVKNIIDKYGFLKDEIIELSFWGMEPTINIDLYDKIVIPLLDYYTNINSFMFSTNAFLGYNSIHNFIRSLENYSRPITFKLQFSLDGPEWINDNSRRKGATERTIKMIKDIIINNQDLKNCSLDLFIKSTLDCHFMEILNQDINKIYEFYDFFNNIKIECASLNKSERISTPCLAMPTLVVPHYHTIKDGYILRDFIRNIYDIDKYESQLFFQVLEHITLREEGFIKYLCSAGLGSLSVDYEGNIYGCHSIYPQAFNGENEKSIKIAHTSLVNKNKRLIQNNELLPHFYIESREAFMDILIFQMALSGQIERDYLSDFKKRELLKACVNSLYCQYGHLSTTKSIWIPTTSYFKLFGNGAMEELVRYNEKWGAKG